MEFTLLGAVLVSFLFAYGLLWFEGGRTNAADCTKDLWESIVTSSVVGLIVGRLAAMVLAGTNPMTAPGDIIIVRGGVDTVAASSAAIASLVWLLRADLWWLLDAAAPAILAGLTGWHGGCLVRDACLGTRSDLPWAMAQDQGGITRHPVELYAAAALLLAAIGMVLWKRRRPPPGVLASVALLCAAAVRLATEPLRLGLGGDLSWWYATGVAIAIGLALRRVRSETESSTTPADSAPEWSRTLRRR